MFNLPLGDLGSIMCCTCWVAPASVESIAIYMRGWASGVTQ